MVFRFRHSRTFDSSLDEVWKVVTEVEKWPEFIPTMSRVEILNENVLTTGSRVLIKQPLQPSQVWTVLSHEEPHLFVWRTGRNWLSLTATHHLESEDGQTRQNLILELDGYLSLPAALCSAWFFPLVLRIENHAFAQRLKH